MSPLTKIHTYIGLMDTVGDDQLSSHRWTVDNTRMTYNNFISGEPGSDEEHCVEIHSSAAFQWFDGRCDATITAFCEFNLVSEHNFEFACDAGLKGLCDANPNMYSAKPEESGKLRDIYIYNAIATFILSYFTDYIFFY